MAGRALEQTRSPGGNRSFTYVVALEVRSKSTESRDKTLKKRPPSLRTFPP